MGSQTRPGESSWPLLSIPEGAEFGQNPKISVGISICLLKRPRSATAQCWLYYREEERRTWTCNRLETDSAESALAIDAARRKIAEAIDERMRVMVLLRYRCLFLGEVELCHAWIKDLACGRSKIDPWKSDTFSTYLYVGIKLSHYWDIKRFLMYLWRVFVALARGGGMVVVPDIVLYLYEWKTWCMPRWVWVHLFYGCPGIRNSGRNADNEGRSRALKTWYVWYDFRLQLCYITEEIVPGEWPILAWARRGMHPWCQAVVRWIANGVIFVHLQLEFVICD